VKNRATRRPSSAIFILEGWSKLRGYEAAATYMDRHSVPSMFLPAVIALELGGGADGFSSASGWRLHPVDWASLFMVYAVSDTSMPVLCCGQ
jgi:hypothetical protein